jgi:ribonuclease P protein component
MMNPEKRSSASSDSIPNSLAPELSGNLELSADSLRSTKLDADDCSSKLQGERFPKLLRLSGREEFAAVFDHGRVEADRVLVVHAVRNSRRFSRIGLSISKKVGSSPTRNYWKRCIREAFRRQRSVMPTGLDIIVRPRRDARPNSRAIAESLYRLLKKVDRQLQS